MSEATGRDAPTAMQIPTPGGFGGSIRRKMPAPFARPSISVGASGPRREWHTIAADQLREGDIVPSVGRLVGVKELLSAPPANSGLTSQQIIDQTTWTVTVVGVDGAVRIYQGGEPVFAFVFLDQS